LKSTDVGHFFQHLGNSLQGQMMPTHPINKIFSRIIAGAEKSSINISLILFLSFNFPLLFFLLYILHFSFLFSSFSFFFLHFSIIFSIFFHFGPLLLQISFCYSIPLNISPLLNYPYRSLSLILSFFYLEFPSYYSQFHFIPQFFSFYLVLTVFLG